ncbi:hypothetical protein [Aquimonas sp.]|jgi:hypothetical protein|uniref:hypothetical protein n=1 Tax=Aquimonas sp. TaxID=1872588 RepID=UPI0037BE8627
MTTPTLTASVTPTPPLTVSQLYTPASTPGNVGLCLSGGGTRACCAGMGQLRAFAALQANGGSLLSQFKAISTVSGGSWLGVPYQYMPASGPSDDTYLGVYDSDQGTLTLAELATLPAGNAGNPMTSVLFSLEGIAGTAVLLYELFLRFNPSNPLPANMLWQTVIGMNILGSYDLFDIDPTSGAPQDFFSATVDSLAAITATNPSLSSRTAYLFADQVSSQRAQRPLHICNMGMFVKVQSESFPLLAPVQANGLMTAVVGTPSGAVDANGLAVGGGGVDSFAFSSTFLSLSGSSAQLTQPRPWSLTDITGTSSVAFAETVQNQIAQWEANPWLFLKWLAQEGDAVWQWIKDHLPEALHATAQELIARGRADAASAPSISFPNPQDLIPQYASWPVAAAATNRLPNTFADGGSLENTGLASLLAFSDIDSAIVCVNSETPLTTGSAGISNGQQGWIAGTQIIVDDAVPPLFGYQPYDATSGYVLYSAGGATPENALFANNQVFDSSAFAGFLSALWAAAGGSAPAVQPAILSQSLTVQANPWFGVQARSTPMTVVWVYLNYASNWASQFANNPAVQSLVASELQSQQFPHYNTLSTELSATQINLLAHFSSWAVVSTDQGSGVFSNLFKAGS